MGNEIKQKKTIKASQFVISAVAGESLVLNDAVYISAADNKAYKCDADDLQKIGFVGFVQEDTVTSGATSTIKVSGVKDGFSGLTPGSVYYLSGTPGGITATKPTNFKIVAEALNTTTVRIVTYLTKRTRVYTTGSTWYNFPGLRWIDVELVGGGQGGGGANNDNNGGPGGTTSFGSHLQATGGSSSGGGIGSGGDFNSVGDCYISNGGVDWGTGIKGASSYFAGGGKAGDGQTGGAGTYGSGGGGGETTSGGTATFNGGYGGSAGGYSRKRIHKSELGSSETITIGAGGTAGGGSDGYGGGVGGNGLVIITEYY